MPAPTSTPMTTMTLADILNGVKLRMEEQMDAANEMKAKAYTDRERLYGALLDAAEEAPGVTPVVPSPGPQGSTPRRLGQYSQKQAHLRAAGIFTA